LAFLSAKSYHDSAKHCLPKIAVSYVIAIRGGKRAFSSKGI